MKNYFLILILFYSFNLFSQENDSIKKLFFDKKHEIRIDPLKFIIHKRLGISYEYFLNKRLSFGLSGTFLTDPLMLENYKNEDFVYDEVYLNKYHIIPNIRYSLDITKKCLYYVEIFTSFNSGILKNIARINDGNVAYYAVVDKKYTNIAPGGCVGWKWYFYNNICLDIFAGLAPNINPKNDEIGVGRVGINFGYRF